VPLRVNRYLVERAAIPAMSAMPPKAEESSLPVMATHMTVISSQQLVNGGTVPFQEI
jgi:hypothetical protein